MSRIPTTTLQYSFPQTGPYKNPIKKEVPIGKLRASDVLVKVHAVSLQYRDLVISKGVYASRIVENLVPASDMAGEVLAVGEDISASWKVGDRVCANFATDHIHGASSPAIQRTHLGGESHGVMTQYRTFPAHSLVKIPEHLSFEETSTLPFNCLQCATRSFPHQSWRLCPCLGNWRRFNVLFALQFAVAAGATVVATSSSDEKLKLASKLGAKHLINYNSTPNCDEEVKRITNGVGVDYVIEVGGPGTLSKSINSAKMGSGYVNIIGFVSSVRYPNVVIPVLKGGVSLRGIQIGSVAQFIDMNRLLVANPDVTRPVVDKVFPFDKAIDAYAYLESQKHVGNVVIKVA